MKFSATTLCLSVASCLVTSSFVAGKAEATKASTAPHPADEFALEGSATNNDHVFPSIFFFEVRKNFADDAEIMAEVEEAYILSANEAHDTNKLFFKSSHINKVRHERVVGLLGETAEHEEESSSGSPGVRGAEEPSDGVHYYPYYPYPNRRRSYYNPGRQYRVNYSSDVSIGCNFCTEDDDNYLGSSFLDAAYYETAEGSEVLQNWEKLFCARLGSIKKLKKPTRCFIGVDFDHEITNDDDEDEEEFVVSTGVLEAE